MTASTILAELSEAPRLEHARLATGGMVCTVDHLASVAGVRLLADGGNAVDAAVAASAALAVTTQNMCGMGGDLWALVHDGSPVPRTLNASGRAGSGADPAQLRVEGHQAMPFRGDIRSVPVPGCVDGWLALHQAYGRAPLGEVLAPAINLADNGFAVAPILATAIAPIAFLEGAGDYLVAGRAAGVGDVVRRPGLARSLRAIVAEGRQGWYEGEFGQGLLRLGGGWFQPEDLARSQADWVEPVTVEAWGHRLWTPPPNSQGYLSLAGAAIAQGLDLPDDPDHPLWAHFLIEASKQAAFDRLEVLHEGADGAALVAESRLASRRSVISTQEASTVRSPGAAGGTIYLCAVDREHMGVSLIQSNASGFGSHLTVPEVGVFLHNRGIGFSLQPGHPAELGPRRRPPSTLSPALITGPDGSLRTVLGTMGGDGQPQVVLQLMAHLLQARSGAGKAMTAPRFTLTVPDAIGFDTWDRMHEMVVALESGSGWAEGLAERGHRIENRPWGNGLFGHAHLIEVLGETLAGVADPRALTGAAIGL
jgi:gamma-glutamyltranspeptidase / glutathione hydrolase